MDKFYSKKHFLKALKDAGLPFTYMTLLVWERKGIIDKPKHMQMMNEKEWRFYTKQEIEDNIKKIKVLKKK